MNKYRITIKKYFGGKGDLEVEADNKEDARRKASKIAEDSDDCFMG